MSFFNDLLEKAVQQVEGYRAMGCPSPPKASLIPHTPCISQLNVLANGRRPTKAWQGTAYGGA